MKRRASDRGAGETSARAKALGGGISGNNAKRAGPFILGKPRGAGARGAGAGGVPQPPAWGGPSPAALSVVPLCPWGTWSLKVLLRPSCRCCCSLPSPDQLQPRARLFLPPEHPVCTRPPWRTGEAHELHQNPRPIIQGTPLAILGGHSSFHPASGAALQTSYIRHRSPVELGVPCGPQEP